MSNYLCKNTIKGEQPLLHLIRTGRYPTIICPKICMSSLVLNLIHDNFTLPALSRTSDSLMVSASSLRELAELLSESEERVNRTQSLNLRSHTTLQHLQVIVAFISDVHNNVL